MKWRERESEKERERSFCSKSFQFNSKKEKIEAENFEIVLEKKIITKEKKLRNSKIENIKRRSLFRKSDSAARKKELESKEKYKSKKKKKKTVAPFFILQIDDDETKKNGMARLLRGCRLTSGGNINRVSGMARVCTRFLARASLPAGWGKTTTKTTRRPRRGAAE